MHRGYIKIWRKMLDNPYMRNYKILSLWVTLLLLANHKERDELLGGKRITCKPGQFTTGRIQLSEETGIHSSSVERILRKLEIEQQIEQRKTSVNRLITIVNWNEYQKNEQPIEQRPNNDRTTTEHTVRIKEYKNNNNIVDSNFEKFYESYPRKISKAYSLKAWAKLDPDSALFSQIMSALSNHKLSWEGKDPKYIPHPATWINQKRWEDQIQVDDAQPKRATKLQGLPSVIKR